MAAASFRQMQGALQQARPLGGGDVADAVLRHRHMAMTRAPIAIVATLRETSVLFGAVIAVVVLKAYAVGDARYRGAADPFAGWF